MLDEIKIESNLKTYKVIFCDTPIEYLKKNVNEGTKIFLVTDTNVYSIYKSFIEELNSIFFVELYIVEAGGNSKNMRNVSKAYSKLIAKNFKRNDITLAFGGGVIGDLAGYIAATFNRGMKFVQIPTTLLSQVDSSIGGKVAIHFEELTNMIGTIYPPEVTLINTKFLNTLPNRELYCGYSEIIKIAYLHDQKLFKVLQLYSDDLLRRTNDSLLKRVIYQSIVLKKEIVVNDEYEKKERLSLNFGHTLGHCLETITQHKSLLHGEAVAIGMSFEAMYGYHIYNLEYSQLKSLLDVLKVYHLPTTFNLIKNENSAEKLLEIMKTDKKNVGDEIALVVPTKESYRIEMLDYKSNILNNELKIFLGV
ncbi:3-dehydroquinate synthase [Enterococcus sp. AN402]|uniref:3-dehydroquinate synthase n=1 Tax=Enterococcus sp. AN402 TaxID=3151386 RepID=UPI00345AF815